MIIECGMTFPKQETTYSQRQQLRVLKSVAKQNKSKFAKISIFTKKQLIKQKGQINNESRTRDSEINTNWRDLELRHLQVYMK